MTNFIKGFLAGLSLLTLVSVGAYATAQQYDNFDAEEAKSRCDVRVGYGHMTSGDQCRYNQVMVGTRNNYLLCADVTVDCQ